MLLTSFAGGFAGVLSEIWYFRDYWRPPTLVNGYSQLEDFLFGFVIVSISSSIYDFVFSRTLIKEKKPRLGIATGLFLLGLVGLIGLSDLLKYNSLLVSSFIFIFISVVVVFIRRDMAGKALVTGLFLMLAALLIYSVLFCFLSPSYWDNYLLLKDSNYSVSLFGSIPLTELLWYFSWGCVGGVFYDFAFGNVSAKRAVV